MRDELLTRAYAHFNRGHFNQSVIKEGEFRYGGGRYPEGMSDLADAGVIEMRLIKKTDKLEQNYSILTIKKTPLLDNGKFGDEIILNIKDKKIKFSVLILVGETGINYLYDHNTDTLYCSVIRSICYFRGDTNR